MAGLLSNGHARGFRDLRHQPSYEFSALLIEPDIESLDDLLLGVTFAIARIPEEFPVVSRDFQGQELRAARYTGNPPLIVWFTYDDEVADLWFLTRSQERPV